MRLFRTFLFILLSVALPIQGYANLALPKRHCPMESATMNKTDADAMHDCCNDAKTAAKTGKPCKPAQPSQSMGQFFPITEQGVLPQASASSVRFPHFVDITFSFDPAATWRPPTQLCFLVPSAA